MKNPSLNHDSLSNIIKWYKGRCSFEINRRDAINCVSTNIGFAWQSRFYDHVIRDGRDAINRVSTLNRIREYIQTNPQMWERDRNNLEIKN